MAGVSKRFRSADGEVCAVNGMDLSVSEGTFLTLLGPSGCGKSTTLRMLAGLEDPDQGRIEIGDRVVHDRESGIHLPPQRRGIGMVFQSLALWPHLTVRENIAYPLRVTRLRRAAIARRTSELLELVDLAGLADRRPGTLSGGQQQRVAIARALAGDPMLLLFDEPFSALDARLRSELGRALKDIQQRLGVTVVYVTHDRQEALRLSDEIGIMHAGRLLQIGRPRDVYRHPTSAVAAALLGDANVFAGRVTDIAANGTISVATQLGPVVGVAQPGSVVLGQHVELCIRTEQLRVGPTPEGSGMAGEDRSHTVKDARGTNRWVGVVERIEFRGSWIVADFRIGDAVLTARLFEDTELIQGAAVDLTCAVDRCAVMAVRTDGIGS
jgi:iron(III) transport system ATP-binding protein